VAARGLYIAPFDELSDPRTLAELAQHAEAKGWDGVFLWDHVRYDGVKAIADPWIALAAIATLTARIRLGPMVTPLVRRRPHKLSREVVTLDHLSGGRVVLGLGLGSDRYGELGPFGDSTDAKQMAVHLDEGLAKLSAYWAGEMEPTPVQRPRIPVWLAARWPNRRPVARAARWDGLFPVRLPGPDALAELAAEVAAQRPPTAGPFDLVVSTGPGADTTPWAQAGATWILTGFGSQPRLDAVRETIDAGP
jgi:alkanesulfonate monooxygenase SsuD/methylene tetrahydromethanopterin reductase-like flavin-dependent oxidoreductase (luciferase family)